MKWLLVFTVLVWSVSARAQEQKQEDWMARNVEVTIPAVVTAGEEFPLIYRATPKDGVRLEPTFATKSKEGRIGQGRVVSTPMTASRWIHQAVITEAGYYLLTFEFKNHGGRTLQATARTKVRPAVEMKALFIGKKWELPRGNLYLSPQKAATWNDVAPAEREIIGTERTFFSPMLEQTDYDTTWWPLRAWNELHEMLQPDFVPPLSLVTARFSEWQTPRHPVAYAAWSQNGFNVIYQSEIGESAWFYIEAPADKPAPLLSAIFQSTLLKSPLAVENSALDAQAFGARSLVRYRATTPSAPLEEVRVWLIQIRQPAELNLRFPGYRAPEKLRIPSPASF